MPLAALLPLVLGGLDKGRSATDASAVKAGLAACQARLAELGRTIDRLKQQRTVAVVGVFAAGFGGFMLGRMMRGRR